MYKSEKRRKELSRKKKQEEKRQRRQKSVEGSETADPTNIEAGSSADSPGADEAQDKEAADDESTPVSPSHSA
jgi:hypothetical protein